MSGLAAETCHECRADSPKVDAGDATKLLLEIPDWTIVQEGGVDRLQRLFKFENFLDALAFTNQVGSLAEEVQHHPLIITEWGRVTLQWWTHSIGGLHRNDFIMAAKADKLFR